MAGVRLESVCKSYTSGANAVTDVSLDIREKEFLVLLGPSGCGKSTLLRMIAGIESISGGSIYIDDVLVNDIEPKDRGVAMVFQNYALYPHMTAYGNMAYGLKIMKLKKNEIQQRIERAASLLQIENLLHRYPSQLSGGQRQRVAIGRAIVKEPKVFLMDEPLSNLDAKLRNETRIEIKKLFEKMDSTFIYVTHDQVEAMTLGDRIAVINEGRVIQTGTPYEVLSEPINSFVAAFVGSPRINFVAVDSFEEGAISIDNRRFSISNQPLAKARDIFVGIRPEYCSLVEDTESGLEMTLDFCELIGTEMLLHLEFRGQKFILKQPTKSGFEQRQRLHVKPDMEKMVFFDGLTKYNLKGAGQAYAA